jgi:multicomponent Na+:H+ antiporter subunit D
VFFMMHVILAKSALFLVSGVAYRLRGTYDLKELGGLYQTSPGLAVLFLIPALSLAGVPPLSGFFAKLALVQAGLATAQYAIVATALGVSLLTLFSMTKIWGEAFWKPAPAPLHTLAVPERDTSLLLPIAVLAMLIVTIGIGAEPLLTLATRAAKQLLDPGDYLRAVLGSQL